MMNLYNLFVLLVLLNVKHFVCDFLLQTTNMVKHKGTFLHKAGIAHAGIHMAGTFLCVFAFFSVVSAIAAALIDLVMHYLIDYSKMNIGQRFDLKPSNMPYWWLIGFDQFLHYQTYVFILYLLAKQYV
jgi:Protein of unknown function (DUF3307)